MVKYIELKVNFISSFPTMFIFIGGKAYGVFLFSYTGFVNEYQEGLDPRVREDDGIDRVLIGSMIQSSRIFPNSYAKRNLNHPAASERLKSLLRPMTIIDTLADDLPLPKAFSSLNHKGRTILFAALQSKSHYLITGDKKAFGKYFGKSFGQLKILRPAQFFEKIN